MLCGYYFCVGGLERCSIRQFVSHKQCGFYSITSWMNWSIFSCMHAAETVSHYLPIRQTGPSCDIEISSAGFRMGKKESKKSLKMFAAWPPGGFQMQIGSKFRNIHSGRWWNFVISFQLSDTNTEYVAGWRNSNPGQCVKSRSEPTWHKSPSNFTCFYLKKHLL